MAKYYDASEADPSLIQGLKVAILGYGNQGHAHALNLRDSGVQVRIGQYEGSPSGRKAREAGFEVATVREVAGWADVIVFSLPDQTMRNVYESDVAGVLRPGQTLMFVHGFNIHFGLIKPPEDVAVAMVSPKGAGFGVRMHYEQGSGLPGLIAVQQDPRGDALAIALSYAWGLGCARAMMLATTFREETETDLFGEQAVLCGGVPALIRAGFETLVAAGYQPEIAYFECLHETKLIVDLLYRGGLSLMNRSISDTAEWGGHLVGPRMVTEETRDEMKRVLTSIQSGEFARNWIAEADSGSSRLHAFRKDVEASDVETVGADLRSRMPFLGN